jgi:cold shock CspA family protein
VQRDDTGETVFFHARVLEGVRLEELWVGHRLEFEMGRRDRGNDPRPQAIRVRLID